MNFNDVATLWLPCLALLIAAGHIAWQIRQWRRRRLLRSVANNAWAIVFAPIVDGEPRFLKSITVSPVTAQSLLKFLEGENNESAKHR